MPEASTPSAPGPPVAEGAFPRLSVVLITLNEERNLATCLERLAFASEIIVADSGSSDRTREIALRFTRHVLEVPWEGFGPTKQRALECATSPWVLSLDADEVVDPELAEAIGEVLRKNDPEIAGYRVNRRSKFLGTWMKHSGWYPDWVLRLGRRECMQFSSHRVHEQLQVNGRVGELAGHLLHYTDPDWPHYLAKLSRYSELSARSLYEQGRRAHLFDLSVRPLYQFFRTYLFQAGFLDGRAGLILACGSAFHVFSKYVQLWNLEREHRCSS